MDTIALDFQSLLSELNRNDDMITKGPTSKNLRPFPRGATIGHIHLKVNNLAISTRFYREILGLDLMQAIHGASFLSLEGYHHRLAINTWLSRGRVFRSRVGKQDLRISPFIFLTNNFTETF